MESICTECKGDCIAYKVDNGPGLLDVGGKVTFVTNWAIESDCCSAPCLNPRTGHAVTISEYDKYHSDEWRDYCAGDF